MFDLFVELFPIDTLHELFIENQKSTFFLPPGLLEKVEHLHRWVQP
jgi:hypothetical protein